MKKSIGVVILAAGKGTRMKIETPKALVPALGKPLLDFVIQAAIKFANENSLLAEIGVVVGHRKELLEQWWENHSENKSIKLAWQKVQSGTADALKACFSDHPHFWNHEYTLVACADTPMLSENEFNVLFQELSSHSDLQGVAATFHATNPFGYGRIVKSSNGFHIVEEKDATNVERRITEVNSGLYIFKTTHLKNVLNTIGNTNKSGEFYLTDLFQDQYKVKAVEFESETPFLGINNLGQLSSINKILLSKKISELFAEGVMILNPESVYFDFDVSIGIGSVIYPGVTILGKTNIDQNVVIESGSFIKDSKISKEVHILANSYIEEAIIDEGCNIGPMGRIRPGSEIGSHSKIGNFVEVKKSKLASGVKVSHLSYVGDAEIGENSNIGCGFITCNYDGASKHKTKIGKNTFIGSDCQVVAPIQIGDDAFVAAGSTITRDLPDGAFGIARTQQVTKEGMAKRFLKSKKS